MKPIIIDMEEMSDSTEVYGTRPSPVFAGIIYALTALLAFAVVWMCVCEIDVVTHANGIVQSSDATATITNVSAGKLAECRVSDGDYIKSGDILFVVESGELSQQKEQCEQELEELNSKIEMLSAYQQALDGEEGALQDYQTNPYYKEYETRYQAIQLNCDTVHSDASAQRSQYQSSINSLDTSIQTADSDKNKLNQMLSDVRNRVNSFAAEDVYYYAAVEEYINRYNLTASQYDSQIAQLKEAEESEEGNESAGKIETLQNERGQALNQVEAEMLASVEQSLSSAEKNLESLQMNRSEAKSHLDNLQNGSEELNADLIIVNEKNAVYAELSTCKSRLTEYEATLASVKSRIEECSVKAQTDGYLNLTADKVAGDYVGAGETLGSIVPKGDGYRTVIYVENQDIGRIHENQPVKYEIPAYPSSEYGKIEGTIQKISKDMKVNQENGSGYYEVEASITYEGGEKDVRFVQGMAMEAKLVTERKSVIRYLLEKIDLLDK